MRYWTCGGVDYYVITDRGVWRVLVASAAILLAVPFLTAETGGQTARAVVERAGNAAAVTAALNNSAFTPYFDTDRDGCDDGVELGADPTLGGQRDPADFWDFFDPNRDGSVSGLDFFALLSRFSALAPTYPDLPSEEDAVAEALAPPPPAPAYHAGHDRGPAAALSGPPDGAISGLDFFSLLVQFGHSCARGWQPNIVVIMTDDQDDMGSMSTMPKTQSLLADQGITFSNSFVDYPLCCPSRASFLTGQAAHNHGVLHNRPPLGGYGVFLPTEDNALPVWLQNAGYTTVHIGKYVNGYGLESPIEHIPPGWSEWYGLPELLGGKSQYYNYGINENGVLVGYGPSAHDYQTDVLTDKAADFVARHETSSDPFFMSIAPLAPHVTSELLFAVPAPRHQGVFANLPLPQPPNFNESDVSDKPSFVQAIPPMDELLVAVATESFRKRREALLAVDDMVEQLIQALTDAGKLDETIIIFTSDNGFVHGEHRRTLGKSLVYEEDIQVPLLLRGPGIAKGEMRVQMVNNLDVVATIMEVADATPGRTLDGRSMVALLRNSAEPWRTALLVQGTDGGAPTSSSRMQAIRTEDFVWAEHISPDGVSTEYELYDLVADPYQLESQHDNPAFAGVRDALQTLLAGLKTCAGASCWVTAPVP